MALTEGLSLMQAWWAAPLGRAAGLGAPASPLTQGRFTQSDFFASHGITPLGYAAFAFVLGVTAGALIRRTIPAMAVTLVRLRRPPGRHARIDRRRELHWHGRIRTDLREVDGYGESARAGHGRGGPPLTGDIRG